MLRYVQRLPFCDHNAGWRMLFSSFQVQSSSVQSDRCSYPQASINFKKSPFVTLWIPIENSGTATSWASNSLSHPKVPGERRNPSVTLPAGILVMRDFSRGLPRCAEGG